MSVLASLHVQIVLVSWPGGSWQNSLKFVLAALGAYLVAMWLLMVWWTFRDIRERSRDPFLQAAAVLVVLVFTLPGLWAYLVMRPKETLAEAYARTLEEEALLQELEDLKACPNCRRRVQDDFVVCPMCQTGLKEPCASCNRPLSYAWAACPFCATPRRPARSAPVGVAAGVTAPEYEVPTPSVNGKSHPLPAPVPVAATQTRIAASRVEPDVPLDAANA